MKLPPSLIIVASALAFAAHSSQAGELHIFTSDAAGFNTHSPWYDDGKEITVIDSQFTPAHAAALLSDIRRQSQSPITRVVVTHPNPDKFNGLSEFHKHGVLSVASAKTATAMPAVDAYKRYFWVNIAKAFSNETYPRFEPVKTTFSGKQIIKLRSGETITLFELGQPGVSSSQTVVRIDSTGDLIVGDLVHSQHHAWLEGGIVDGKASPTLVGWKADLRELLKLGHGKVFGGRGVFLPVKDAVAQEIAYLDKADAIVDDYVKGLAGKLGELSDPKQQGRHYQAIQAELAKAFPDYALPDLVGYSVYGLVEQKLAALPGGKP